MRIIKASEVESGQIMMDRNTQLWVYNGLDCTVTNEIYPHLRAEMDRRAGDGAQKAYDFERALLGPAMTMMRRGLRVDEVKAAAMITPLKTAGFKLRVLLNYLALVVWGKRLNPASPIQLQEFFYKFLGVPEQKKQEKGTWKVTTNSEAMEKIRDQYPRGAVFANIILELRDIEKKLAVLTAERDRDGRMRTSFNVAGTETWRWSSSTSPFWNGINMQNVTKDLRSIFTADEGRALFYADLEQAESRTVAYLSGDEKYIAACEGGDLHTTVCRMTWPQFDWDGTSDEGLPFALEQDADGWWQIERHTGQRYNTDPFARRDRAIAEMPFISIYSFRDMCKRSGHGCVTGGHEVLTHRGWVPIETLNEGVPIATWDAATRGIVWDVPSKLTAYNYVGNLHHFKGNAYDLTVTHDHRMPYFANNKVLWKQADAMLSHKAGNLPVSGKLEGTLHLDDNTVRLICAFHADGHKDTSSPSRLRFTFKKQRKIKRLCEILDALNLPYDITDRDDGAKIIRVSSDIKKYGMKPDARMLNWSLRARQVYLDELGHWDGHFGKTKAMWVTSADQETSEWINTIAHVSGKGSQLGKKKTSGFGSDIYPVSVNNRQFASRVSMTTKVTPTDGTMVYCVTVPTSYFLVRRNGHIMVTGNTNYGLQPTSLARHLKIEQKHAIRFQLMYYGGIIEEDSLYRWHKQSPESGFDRLIEGGNRLKGGLIEVEGAFPGIRRWHDEVARELQLRGKLTTPFGFTREFWGRTNDATTLRAAIAFLPQSTIGCLLNVGLWRLWRECEPNIQMLGQVHDAVLGQVPAEEIDRWSEIILDKMVNPLYVNGRTMIIPSTIEWGPNWKDMKKWKPTK